MLNSKLEFEYKVLSGQSLVGSGLAVVEPVIADETMSGVERKTGKATVFEPTPDDLNEMLEWDAYYKEYNDVMIEEGDFKADASSSDSSIAEMANGTSNPLLVGNDQSFQSFMQSITASSTSDALVPERTVNQELQKKLNDKLYQLHLEDLRKSGLSDEMIDKMGCMSFSGEEIYKKIYKTDEEEVPAKWNHATGYSIPYGDVTGQANPTRYRIFWSEYVLEADPKLPKYLSPKGASTEIYVPPGFREIDANYVIITEGEKKAAKAVQEGFPCIALAGVWMWLDSGARKKVDKAETHASYLSPLVPELAQIASQRKCVVIFDHDPKPNKQVSNAAYTLKEALYFQATRWCRRIQLPIPKCEEGRKWGIDDFLISPQGKTLLQNALNDGLVLPSEGLSPLFKYRYKQTGGKDFHCFVKNYPRWLDTPDEHLIVKQIPKEDENGVVRVEEVGISNNRTWISRIIHSVDGDGNTLYELTYFDQAGHDPKRIIGTAELLNVSSGKDDLLAHKGAKVLSKYKGNMEEFLLNCHKFGIPQGTVQQVYGTTQRGWREGDHLFEKRAFIISDLVITETDTFTSESRSNALVPINSGSDDALKKGIVCKGDFNEWKRQIEDHVLHSPIPALIFGAGLAGLLRDSCNGSENFIIHLYGTSSGGKTTALKAAASAWGNPKRLVDQWKATANGLERKAVGRNDMALFLDESGMADDHEVTAAIYSLGNGGEKMRSTKDVKERTTTKFNLVTLSTGEKQLAMGSKFVGQEVRALDVRADVDDVLWRTIDNVQQAEAFGAFLDENYGHALEPMIRGILSLTSKDRKTIQKLWKDHTDRIRASVPDSDIPQHVLRRLKHFGLCTTAMAIFLQYVMEYDEDLIDNFTERQIGLVSNKLVQFDSDQFKRGEELGILQHFLNGIASNQGNFLNDLKPGPMPKDLYGSIEGSLVFCIPGPLGEMMQPYGNSRLVQAAEKHDALLTRQHGKRKTISHRIGGVRPDCYVFDISKIEAAVYEDE